MYIHSHVLRCAGDASAALTLDEKVINDRVQLFMYKKYHDVVLDLRALNSRQKTKYDMFLDDVKKFLQEDVGLADEEQRHSEVTRLTRTIFVRDLLEQVSARSLPSMCICSCEMYL